MWVLVCSWHRYVKVNSCEIAVLLNIFLNNATTDCFTNLEVFWCTTILFTCHIIWLPWKLSWQECMCYYSYQIIIFIKWAGTILIQGIHNYIIVIPEVFGILMGYVELWYLNNSSVKCMTERRTHVMQLT